MRWLVFTLMLLVITLLNAGNLPDTVAIGRFGLRPDLLVIMLVFFAGNYPIYQAITASFAIGFAADISSATMGPATVAFGLLGSLMAYMPGLAATRNIVSQFITALGIAFVTGAAVQFLTWLKTGSSTPNIWAVLGGCSLYTALVTPLVWRILWLLTGLLGIRNYRVSRFFGR